MCDQLVIINQGDIVRQGSLEEFANAQAGLVEVRVNHSLPKFKEALDRRGVAWKDLLNGALLIAVEDDPAKNAVFGAARDAGAHVRHYKPVRRRLEETFLDAIRGPGEGSPPPVPKTVDESPQAAAGGAR